MRRGIAIGVVAAGMLTAPASAAAYNVSVSVNGTMTVTDGGSLRITFDGTEYEVGDTASVPSATPPCSVTGGETSACPAGAVARVNATATIGIFMDDFGGPDAVEVPSTLTLTDFNTQANGGNGNDLITTTYPDPSQDVFDGGPGNDTLRTGPSNGNVVMDQLQGGPGNDVLDGGVGPDMIAGGSGTDRLEYPGRSDALAVTLPDGPGTDIGNGGSADGPGSRDTISEIENVTGGTGADSITGNALANVLVGGAGNDQLAGVGGGDSASGGTGNDQLGGGSGNDSLLGEGGNDQLAGGTDNDALQGGAGADRLIGDAGVDSMLGQLGIDKLFARDGIRDTKINCGPGKNRRERARRDRRDPPAKSC